MLDGAMTEFWGNRGEKSGFGLTLRILKYEIWSNIWGHHNIKTPHPDLLGKHFIPDYPQLFWDGFPLDFMA